MTSLYLIARALDRQRSGLNALGTAALLILVADPRALYEASFQMTVLVIIAVAGLAGRWGSARLADGDWRLTAPDDRDGCLSPAQGGGEAVWLRMWGGVCQDVVGAGWAGALPGLRSA